MFSFRNPWTWAGIVGVGAAAWYFMRGKGAGTMGDVFTPGGMSRGPIGGPFVPPPPLYGPFVPPPPLAGCFNCGR